MPKKNKNHKTLEKLMRVMTITNDVTETQQPIPESPNLKWFKAVLRRRESFDAIVTKHIFDKLKQSRISNEQIVDMLIETGCPLDFALLMGNADVIRMMLERREKISKNESCLLIELAMRMPNLENIKVLVRYGPEAEVRLSIFSTEMLEMINNPSADLTVARRYVEQLMIDDIIDERTLLFIEKTFETGKVEAIMMLLDCRIDEYVKNKCGDSVLVHLFGNVNLENLVDMLRGRPFNVNAKCGDMSALHFATVGQLEHNVRILLNSGADPNIRDYHGMTPLFGFGDIKCTTLLLQNGADVQAIADNGYTILDMMFDFPVQEIILAHIALIKARGVEINDKLHDKIFSNSSFAYFYQKSCKQIEDMKQYRIHTEFTLWTALVCRFDVISRFVKSQHTVDQLMRQCRYFKIHVYYLSTLDRNLNIALLRHGLEVKATEKLFAVLKKFRFDEIIVEKIVNFLPYEHLLSFA